MNRAFIVISIFFVSVTNAQSADFLILKKHGRNIATFFTGSEISYITNSGAGFNGSISGIRKDSIYIKEFIVQLIPTTFGSIVRDTIGSNTYKHSYKDIKAIGKNEKKNFNWRGSGAALMGGGVLISLGSAAVYIFDREKFSAPLLGAAVGLGTAGYFIAKGGSPVMNIGKKYQLVYMKMEQ